MKRELTKFLAPMQRKIGQLISRCTVNLVNDIPKMQECQIDLLADEIQDGKERMQQYGFTSVPLPGAEGLAVCVGAERGHVVIIAVEDRRYRITGLADGEVAIYTDEGDKVHFKRGNIIDIVTDTLNIIATTKVSISSPLVEVPSGDVTASSISLKNHVHGGVQSGSSTTGVPQ